MNEPADSKPFAIEDLTNELIAVVLSKRAVMKLVAVERINKRMQKNVLSAYKINALALLPDADW